jgi:uncharacterized protein YbjT (DUF2867 family)
MAELVVFRRFDATQPAPATGPLVCVTGGLGFLGRYIVRELKKLDPPVCIAVLDVSVPAPAQRDPSITYFAADVRDEAALKRAFEGADTVFHVASLLPAIAMPAVRPSRAGDVLPH